MPHITVEVPASLRHEIDWKALFVAMHHALASNGYARLEDFKSRVVVLHEWQVADSSPAAVFLFATLETMNPRPAEMLRAMGAIVHQMLEAKATEIAGGNWIQVCVKVASTTPEDYFKSHINAPALKPGKFSPGE
jgi:5-carboxymethyl-2-hydroxymuconate isomerase